MGLSMNLPCEMFKLICKENFKLIVKEKLEREKRSSLLK